jgi:uncharacterized membrane protein YfcA
MIVWFFVAAFLAGLIGTVAGFGLATVLLPIALLFFDFKTALVLVAITHLFGNIGRVTFFHRKLAWRIIGYFGLLGIPGTLLGAVMVTHINESLLEAVLGVFLIGYGIFALAEPSFKLKPEKSNMIIGGISSGFVAGLIGMGGGVRTAFLSAYKLHKTQYIATAGAIAFVVDGIRIPVYLHGNFLDSYYYPMLPLLFVLAVSGSYAGKKLAAVIPQTLFSRVVLLCLIAAGAKLVLDYF